MNNERLAQADPEIAAIIDSELSRQRSTLELIASENIFRNHDAEQQLSCMAEGLSSHARLPNEARKHTAFQDGLRAVSTESISFNAACIH